MSESEFILDTFELNLNQLIMRTHLMLLTQVSLLALLLSSENIKTNKATADNRTCDFDSKNCKKQSVEIEADLLETN
jgi:hypothetical protein